MCVLVVHPTRKPLIVEVSHRVSHTTASQHADTIGVLHKSPRRGGRVAEGGGLLNRYTGQNLYRGFESLPLRHSLRYPVLTSC
jgi:hypothetical protein